MHSWRNLGSRADYDPTTSADRRTPAKMERHSSHRRSPRLTPAGAGAGAPGMHAAPADAYIHQSKSRSSSKESYEKLLKEEFDDAEYDDDDLAVLGISISDSHHRSTRSGKSKSPMRLLQKPQQAAALGFLASARRRGARLALLALTAWLLLALLWIRWPVYYRELFPTLQEALGNKMEVEPAVVAVAVVAPFLAAGALFYSHQRSIGSLADSMDNSRVMRWLRAHPRLGQWLGLDAVDLVAIAVFLLLNVNLVVGKLLIDQEAGKLAKSGLLDRSVRALGMNGLYALVLSVLLVARQSFFHQLCGLSAERAAKYHVWTSQFGFTALLTHSLGYICVWYMKAEVLQKLVPCLEPDCSPKMRYGTTRNFLGLLAMLPLLAVFLSSLEWVRRRHFQRFVTLHSLTVPFIVLTALHYYPAVLWLLLAVVPYVMYRMASAFGRGQASVVSATALSDKVFQLELRRSVAPDSDFRPGQYVYIKADGVAKNQWHPFTISSSPLRNRHSFMLDAKVQGAFTAQLLAAIKAQQLTSVHVDGYYGSEIQLAPHMVLVAGGSGMTPFLSILEHLKLLAEAADRDELSDAAELPRTLWVLWTCRDLELLEAHAELLDAVRRCSRWKCHMWLHHTATALEDDDTEPEDASCDASPRVLRFFPQSMTRHRFSGHGDMLGLPLLAGATLGCALLMLLVLRVEGLPATSFVRRSLLLMAAALGSVLGASVVLYVLRQVRARKSDDGREGTMGAALGEMEVAGLDASPATPATPRALPTPAQSLLARNFALDKERPELRTRLRAVHSEIRENYGLQARVALLVSGPAELQEEAQFYASELQHPFFAVDQKSFLL